jgi:hypothetical protein
MKNIKIYSDISNNISDWIIGYAFVIVFWEKIYRDSWIVRIKTNDSTEAECIWIRKAFEYLYDKFESIVDENFEKIYVYNDNYWIKMKNPTEKILLHKQQIYKLFRLIRALKWSLGKYSVYLNVEYKYSQARKRINDKQWYQRWCDIESRRNQRRVFWYKWIFNSMIVLIINRPASL